MLGRGMPPLATADALLATKFSPPRTPRALIARPRLLDMLDAGVQGPVTLIAAPPGAGKSALVSSWVAERTPPGPVAWLSLDTDDADRRHFWRAVLEALTRATGDEAYCTLAAIALQQSRSEESAELLDQAADALRDARDRPLRAVHALTRSLLLTDAGQPDAALTVLQIGRTELGDWPLLAQVESQLVAQEALLRTAVGERELGREMLERAEREAPVSLAVATALAKLHLLDGDAERARELLASHLDLDRAAAPHELPLSVRAEAWLIDALALDALGEHAGAAAALERALDFAGPAGLRRLIVAQGGAARALLRRHARNGTSHPAIVGEALDALEHRGNGASRPPFPLAAALSDREQAILRYLPTMMSNQEIAGELYVSVNTVKTHLKAIYRKLDAADRRHAVERGRELGLMP
jgi:LuxR family maltose regulon positive regulatory protein